MKRKITPLLFLMLLVFVFCLEPVTSQAKVITASGPLTDIRKAPSPKGRLVKRGRRTRYRLSSGAYAKNTWLKLNGNYYFANQSGYLCKGVWLDYNGNRYYLKKTGEALRGWAHMGSKWRYFKPNGILSNYKYTRQLVMVQGKGSSARVALLDKTDSTTWKEVFHTTGRIGRLGVGSHREGLPNTPKGTYRFGQAFGTLDNPGTAYSYTKVDDSHYWVDDSSSAYYNQFVSTNEVQPDWSSAEHLIDYPTAYAYALSVNYNTEAKPGKGSAIFLHCSTGGPTAGCISVPQDAMVYLLKNIKKNARIIISKS